MGLNLIVTPVGPLQGNCYMVYDEDTRDAIVIDPGEDAEIINAAIGGARLNVAAILLTHGHSDHLGATAEVAAATGAPVYGSLEARSVLADPENYRLFPGMPEFEAAEVTGLLDGGETLDFKGISVEVNATPGHTPGSLTFFAYDGLFCGDLVFSGSVGRTDLPGGSFDDLTASVRRLVARYPGETAVYPGHGNPTTLGYEKENNPFLKEMGL